jgi:S1-C subfamily serine protease
MIRADGLVLTIGYLVTEAETVWISHSGGRAVSGHVLAFDQETGFGLVQALARLDLPALPLGSSKDAEIGERVVVAGAGGRQHAVAARIIAKQEFAGYWEYVLDEALFAEPAHPQWGGSALIGADGRLLGIGSLLVEEKAGERSVQGNMFVPVDLLEPILEDLVTRGRARRPARPWLGMYTTEIGNKLVVAGLAPEAPAERAGLKIGDVVVEVSGQRVRGLGELFRSIWRLGPAGVEVPLTLSRAGAKMNVRLKSADRADFLKKPSLH